MYMHIIHISRSVSTKLHQLFHPVSSKYHELSRLNITNWTENTVKTHLCHRSTLCIYVTSTYQEVSHLNITNRVTYITRTTSLICHEPSHVCIRVTSTYQEVSHLNITNWVTYIHTYTYIYLCIYIYIHIPRTESLTYQQLSHAISFKYHQLTHPNTTNRVT